MCKLANIKICERKTVERAVAFFANHTRFSPTAGKLVPAWGLIVFLPFPQIDRVRGNAKTDLR